MQTEKFYDVVPALALPRRQHQGSRRGCVLRSRQMVLLEPPGIDARLPAGLLREAGIARHPTGRTGEAPDYRRRAAAV
jgi:hypothetical protein